MGYYSALNGKGILTHATIWMKRQKDKYCIILLT